MEITKVVKPFFRRGWPNTNIVYVAPDDILRSNEAKIICLCTKPNII